MFITLSITSKQAFRKFTTRQANKTRLFGECVQIVAELLQTLYTTWKHGKSRL